MTSNLPTWEEILKRSTDPKLLDGIDGREDVAREISKAQENEYFAALRLEMARNRPGGLV